MPSNSVEFHCGKTVAQNLGNSNFCGNNQSDSYLQQNVMCSLTSALCVRNNIAFPNQTLSYGTRRHSWTKFVTGRPVQFHWHILSHTVIQTSRERDILGVHGTVRFLRPNQIHVHVNDVECQKPGNGQTCFENAKEVTEYAKQFQLGRWCFCGLGHERVAPYERRSTTRKMKEESEASYNKKLGAEPFLKGDLKSKKCKETIHSQRTIKHRIIVRNILACNRFCIYAAVCVWFDQNNHNKQAFLLSQVLHGRVVKYFLSVAERESRKLLESSAWCRKVLCMVA